MAGSGGATAPGSHQGASICNIRLEGYKNCIAAGGAGRLGRCIFQQEGKATERIDSTRNFQQAALCSAEDESERQPAQSRHPVAHYIIARPFWHWRHGSGSKIICGFFIPQQPTYMAVTAD